MQNITVNEFMTAMINKVNALVAANSRRVKPWTRRDFIQYIQGACDWFKFASGEDMDAEAVMTNIYIESDIINEIEPMK